MKVPWHIAHPRDFEELRWELRCRYPGLNVEVRNDHVLLSGRYALVHDGNVIEHYDILVILPQNYPTDAPVLFETGGKIPHDIDRHVIPKTGAACTFLPEAQWRDFPKGSDVFQFLDGPVRQFFISQMVFEETGEWPMGHWRHAQKGVLDFYEETFGTRDVDSIAQYLRYLAAKKLRGHVRCPVCGKVHVRDCHLDRLKQLREVMPRAHAMFCLERLRKLFPGHFATGR